MTAANANPVLANAQQRYEVHRRSEEHTSELQSLMRISYAVFCLKKKKQHSQHHSDIHIAIVVKCVHVLCLLVLFLKVSGDHRDLHVRTHSGRPRRSPDLAQTDGCSTCRPDGSRANAARHAAAW